MIQHSNIDAFELHQKIRNRSVVLGGNSRLKIYGTLSCKLGMRMHRRNRVFFKNRLEAVALGYRPCGHCMSVDFKDWKNKQ